MKDKPAFPTRHFPSRQAIAQAEGCGLPTPEPSSIDGMTLREYAAIKLMAAIIIKPPCGDATIKQIARWSKESADALLAELQERDNETT